MFYEPDKGNHGLPRNPLKSCVVPRPIGWITTLCDDGRINLAPFSQFQLLSFDPAYVMFSASTHPPDFRYKDSIVNAERRGEFVYNMATWALRHAVTRTSSIIDPHVDEMRAVGLDPAPSRLLATPRLAQSPISFECRHYSTVTLPGHTPLTTHHMVIGRVVGVHIDDSVIRDGKIDIESVRPLARMGYTDYTSVEKVFAMFTPEEERNRSSVGLDGGS
jgi:flavin reductase (DIM6/NTAB) family NADH-FMN oxidoreductase RutF